MTPHFWPDLGTFALLCIEEELTIPLHQNPELLYADDADAIGILNVKAGSLKAIYPGTRVMIFYRDITGRPLGEDDPHCWVLPLANGCSRNEFWKMVAKTDVTVL